MNNYFPVCRECGWHAEMYFGVWQLCPHQRKEEQANGV